MGNILESDLAYAAGIIDGEGSICVAYCKQSSMSSVKNYGVAVSVGMVDPEVPLWLKSIFGGNVDTYKGKRLVYRWKLHARKCADFLEMVSPYMKLKRARSEAAVQLARMARPHRGSPKGSRGNTSLSEDEIERKRPLAEFIRSENQRSNPKIAGYSKWGVQ